MSHGEALEQDISKGFIQKAFKKCGAGSLLFYIVTNRSFEP